VDWKKVRTIATNELWHSNHVSHWYIQQPCPNCSRALVFNGRSVSCQCGFSMSYEDAVMSKLDLRPSSPDVLSAGAHAEPP
jgi:hypothetical protein